MPSSERKDTSGSNRSRNVTTPKTALSDLATSETWRGSGMISCTPPSGTAYSCEPSSKLINEALQWLDEDLASWSAILLEGKESGRVALIRKLNSWKNSAYLAPIRNRELLKTL